MNLAILASTFSGNKGAAAMLKSAVRNLCAAEKDLKVSLLSVYPKEDAQQNPYGFLNIVPAKPEQMIFVAFPAAVLYFAFKRIGPFGALLLKHPILKALHDSDLVLDQAGISFVDSRGFVMNTYNFVCIAIPLLLGKPVVKYSQALGPFDTFWNRTMAKLALPKVKRIGARGDVTKRHLETLGLQNVTLCADGAFILPEDPKETALVQDRIMGDSFYQKPMVSVSISSVVEKYCEKSGLDYKGIMCRFIDHLIQEKGYGVLIIANAARAGKTGRKNNDLPVCQAVYDGVQNKERCRWYPEEFTPEAIREFIGLSQLMVASRFHAMIGALYKGVPVLLVGWSHKYKEVLDMFKLGRSAIDYKKLDYDDLVAAFSALEAEQDEIRTKIRTHLGAVQRCAYKNIEMILEALGASGGEK